MSTPRLAKYPLANLPKDLSAGVVVFLVALPLCLGIAVASGVDPFAGILSGIIGGLVVGAISGSHTSVSGPAAGLTAIVLAQLAILGSFEAFLLAVVLAGVLQIAMGVFRAGALSSFFPTSVIKGLLAAIGVILILKQIPHLFGHDADPEGDMAFSQPDKENTFSEIGAVISSLIEGNITLGATVIGLSAVAILLLWDRVSFLKKLPIPAPLLIVVMGVGLQFFFQRLGSNWVIEKAHLVAVPVADSPGQFFSFLTMPDFSQFTNGDIYVAAFTIAIVASLETLLNLEAVDKLDKEKRSSPPNRELIAQGVGNITAGLIGGLPVTSVIVRGSVNVNMGAKTKLSAIFHAVILLVFVMFFASYLNMIPLASLAAILLVTGLKLASPKLMKQMWDEGRYQFIPFIVTLVSIVFTDLLIGILIGLATSLVFILASNVRRPIRQIVETHLDGDIIHIELANQVSFLNKAALDRLFNNLKPGQKLLIDASGTDYIDPDILGLIRDFKEHIAPNRDVLVNLRGFRKRYQLQDDIQFADFTSRELQGRISPEQVLEILVEGNQRFQSGRRLTRDLARQVNATAAGQNPLAVVLSCIDSRVPAELVFDLGIGDIFSVRVAGNIVGTKTLGSMEYAVKVAGVKLVMVLGHSRCGAVTSSVKLLHGGQDVETATGCQHLQQIVDEIEPSLEPSDLTKFGNLNELEQEEFVDEIARANVVHTVHEVIKRSRVIHDALEAGQVMVVGGLYDVKSGAIEILMTESNPSAIGSMAVER
ncbi:C4-dicarboxylic acid transporter DauA [Polystyrenella longa]|uniref:C4-dicarboxylic acid transporter DauA n=1 Tax=Polystyrenella longa TaxID=2528007 RepID=A0A518CS69_9PLAN|nr:SulP family inorganic anion transporter [Polystyrenella longa]QDU82044.1 C4-dicarboxylic acid transporter DauA [Polystyrenella longa]